MPAAPTHCFNSLRAHTYRWYLRARMRGHQGEKKGFWHQNEGV